MKCSITMKYCFYCILCSLFCSGLSYGQQTHLEVRGTAMSSIELKMGAVQQKEGNLHHKVFDGFNYTFQYSRLKRGKKLSSLNTSIGISHLKTDLEEGFSSVNTSLSLDYHKLFPHYRKGRWDIQTGFGFKLNYNISYYGLWDESHFYWTNFLSLNLAQRISYELREKKFVVMDLTMPMFLLLSRPEAERNFKMDDFSFWGFMQGLHYQPEFQFLAVSNFLNVTLEYQYQRKKRIQPVVCYSFSYLNMKTSYSKRSLVMQNLIRLKWSL